MSEDSQETTTSQAAAEAPIAVSELLSPAQGETIVRPRPDPTRTSTRVSAAAASAPAMIAAQLIAERVDSFAGAVVTISIDIGRSYRKNNRRRMMIGIGIPKSQSRMPRPI